MIQCATRRYDDVHESAFYEFLEHSAGSGGDEVSCEREKLYAVRGFYHVFEDVDGDCGFSRGETPSFLHLLDQFVYGHVFWKRVVFYGFFQQADSSLRNRVSVELLYLRFQASQKALEHGKGATMLQDPS